MEAYVRVDFEPRLHTPTGYLIQHALHAVDCIVQVAADCYRSKVVHESLGMTAITVQQPEQPVGHQIPVQQWSARASGPRATIAS